MMDKATNAAQSAKDSIMEVQFNANHNFKTTLDKKGSNLVNKLICLIFFFSF